MVPIMSTTETVNCTTTSTLRGIEANLPTLNEPFNTFTGRKDDSPAGFVKIAAPAFLLPKAKLQIAPASPVQTNYENLPLHK